jgi:hypothetical protein
MGGWIFKVVNGICSNVFKFYLTIMSLTDFSVFIINVYNSFTKKKNNKS